MSQLVATEGDQLAPTELYPLCLLLLLAGFETTVNLIGNTVLALLDRPDQWQALVEDPALAAAAVEETLRWDPPVQRTVRTPLSDLELAGVAVPQGSMVVLYLAGANRDPDAYDDPTASTSPVRAGPSIWPSRPASTTASGLRWRGSRRPSRCSSSSSASLGCSVRAGCAGATAP